MKVPTDSFLNKGPHSGLQMAAFLSCSKMVCPCSLLEGHTLLVFPRLSPVTRPPPKSPCEFCHCGAEGFTRELGCRKRHRT